MSNLIGIVIVNWNNKDVILDCLESVEEAGHIGCTLVSDNGSGDDSVRLIRQKYPQVKILENGRNLGYAGGNNKGIRCLLDSGAKYIFILNPDTQIEKNTIKYLFEAMEKDSSVGISGPKILDRERKIWSAGGVLDKKRFSGGLIGLGEKNKDQYSNNSQVDYIPGTALMVRREVFEKVGLFYGDYFIYYEDTELSLRARKAGYKTMYVSKAVIHHLESSSFGKASSAHQYFMARNHLLFVERNAPLLIKLREYLRLPKTVKEHIAQKEYFALRGIRDYFLRRLGKHENWN